MADCVRIDFTVCRNRDDAGKVEFYDGIASHYDRDYGTNTRTGPSVLAAGLGTYVVDNRQCVEILDVAAGTGAVAIELQKLGFVVIDALDPSPGMLDKARSKAIYRNYLCQFLTAEPSDTPDDSYDCVVMCSAIGSGHLPPGAIMETHRITRPGGFIAIAANIKNMHKEFGDCRQEFQAVFDSLHNAGKWTNVTEQTFPNYNGESDGILLIFKVS